jgi:hypothetical protein
MRFYRSVYPETEKQLTNAGLRPAEKAAKPRKFYGRQTHEKFQRREKVSNKSGRIPPNVSINYFL